MSSSNKTSWLRFSLAAILLASGVVFLQARSRAEIVPPHRELAQFPRNLGDLVGRDESLPAEYLAVLGPGDFLTRSYADPSGQTPPVSLYIAYFPSQRAGDTIHSPKNCLPGSGWAPLSSDHMQLNWPGRSPITVNRYLLGNGSERWLVLYWYQAHGRAVASEYSAKFYLVADAMRMNRTDGALVRILTPVSIGTESVDGAQARLVAFSQNLLPLLDSYIPQ